MLEQLHKESFAPYLDQAFHVVQPEPAGVDLKLTEVIEQINTPRQEAFSVVFHGPEKPFMQQGTYHLRHEKLGELELFLVPIARDREGYQYEAVFNRLIPAG